MIIRIERLPIGLYRTYTVGGGPSTLHETLVEAEDEARRRAALRRFSLPGLGHTTQKPRLRAQRA